MCNFRFHYSCKTSDFFQDEGNSNKVVQIFGESHPNYENSDNVSNAPANSFLDMIQSSDRGNLFQNIEDHEKTGEIKVDKKLLTKEGL